MAKAEATVEELVGMIERGELRLPEMQRQYVWRSTRVRDLLDSLYRGYPSGAILIWETDEVVPIREFALSQQASGSTSTRLLLDGQQRLTSLSAVIRGEPVTVRGRRKPIELLFNLEHPEGLAVVTEVNEDGDDDEDEDELIDDEADSSQDELQKRFDRMTFVVATRKLEQQSHWVGVSDVFKTDENAPFLERAGVERVSDPRYKMYCQRLARLRGIRKDVYRMDILERTLSYDEVTEIFVRVNSLGAKLRSSDLALAQITAKWRGALKTFQIFQEQCAKVGFDLDLGLHLKNLIAFATGQSRFLTVGGLPVETIKQAWKDCVPGMEFALNFLRRVETRAARAGLVPALLGGVEVGQSALHGGGLPRDHPQERLRREIRKATALLPVLERALGDAEGPRELRLREADLVPDRLRVDLLRQMEVVAPGVGFSARDLARFLGGLNQPFSEIGHVSSLLPCTRPQALRARVSVRSSPSGSGPLGRPCRRARAGKRAYPRPRRRSPRGSRRSCPSRVPRSAPFERLPCQA